MHGFFRRQEGVGGALFDRKTNDIVFDVNFWHYRAIVEAVCSLRVLPDFTGRPHFLVDDWKPPPELM